MASARIAKIDAFSIIDADLRNGIPDEDRPICNQNGPICNEIGDDDDDDHDHDYDDYDDDYPSATSALARLAIPFRGR